MLELETLSAHFIFQSHANLNVFMTLKGINLYHIHNFKLDFSWIILPTKAEITTKVPFSLLCFNKFNIASQISYLIQHRRIYQKEERSGVNTPADEAARSSLDLMSQLTAAYSSAT